MHTLDLVWDPLESWLALNYGPPFIELLVCPPQTYMTSNLMADFHCHHEQLDGVNLEEAIHTSYQLILPSDIPETALLPTWDGCLGICTLQHPLALCQLWILSLVL
jgi:hypothetical protein